MVSPPKRPWSLVAIALFQGLISGLSLVSGLLLLLLVTGYLQVLGQDLTRFPWTLKGLVGLGTVISLEGAIATVGLWQLRPWGWLGSVLFHLLCVVNTGLTLAAGQSLTPGVGISTAVSVLLGVALMQPALRPRSH